MAPTKIPLRHGSFPQLSAAVFDGPLDLLLHLVRLNEVEISEISLAAITADYLTYVTALEEVDLDAAGEYLLIAATLIEIKSRLMLPSPPLEVLADEGPAAGAELVARLRDYEALQAPVAMLREWEQTRQDVFFRAGRLDAGDYGLPLAQEGATPDDLFAAMRRVLDAAGVGTPLAIVLTPRRRMSLRLSMARIMRAIAGRGRVEFDTFFELPCSRMEIVLTFLAVLELLRIGRIVAEQSGSNAPIVIRACGRPE